MLVNCSTARCCTDESCDCVLRFYDVSKSDARRWCSMSACGNRSKARNHYARNRHR
ncbi:CGNR zinc finger domain-containing protein [Rhodococcoides kyotonense]|uniref:CGNR zinc finger domain-containing protein n=1 Tax=Rhodococcoides kyotonense TaxID=398843 RepID=UPI001FECE5DC|nr:CGNR zinc finger domain-containing protein [Rhodococcus kyotonensis]